MAGYSDAAEAAVNALTGEGGLVEEYQYRNLRVRRGTVKEQIAAAAMAEGLAVRRAGGGLLGLAKFQEPRP